MRFVLLASLLAGPSGLSVAADAPTPLTEEERAKTVAKWRESYSALIAYHTKQAEMAKKKLQFKETAKEGRDQLAAANKAIAKYSKSPLDWFAPKIEEKPALGLIGVLSQPSVIVGETRPEGAVVTGLFVRNSARIDSRGRVFGSTESNILVTYLIAEKTGVRKGQKLNLPGAWRVTGMVEIDGEKVPVLHAVDIKPEEITKK